MTEGRAWLDALLARGGSATEADASARSKALNGAGVLAHVQGDYARAAAYHQEALALRRCSGDRRGIVASLNNLGIIEKSRGDAAGLYRDSLSRSWALNDRRYIPYNLEGLASIAVTEGQPERAARLFGAAEALRETGAAAVQANERNAYERAIGVTRAALGDDAFAAAFAAGRALPLEQAVDMALDEGDPAVAVEVAGTPNNPTLLPVPE